MVTAGRVVVGADPAVEPADSGVLVVAEAGTVVVVVGAGSAGRNDAAPTNSVGRSDPELPPVVTTARRKSDPSVVVVDE